MEIIVKSLEELTVDGQTLGPVMQAMVEHKLDPQTVQAALYDWRDRFLTEKAAEIQTLHVDHVAEKEVLITAHQEELQRIADEATVKVEEASKEKQDLLTKVNEDIAYLKESLEQLKAPSQEQ